MTPATDTSDLIKPPPSTATTRQYAAIDPPPTASGGLVAVFGLQIAAIDFPGPRVSRLFAVLCPPDGLTALPVAAFGPPDEMWGASDDGEARPGLAPDLNDAVIDGHDAVIDTHHAANDDKSAATGRTDAATGGPNAARFRP